MKRLKVTKEFEMLDIRKKNVMFFEGNTFDVEIYDTQVVLKMGGYGVTFNMPHVLCSIMDGSFKVIKGS